MPEPLAGLRVVEFGQLLAGPYVGTLLGDFGADVVKIEAPPGGDPMRDWGRLRHNDHSLWWSILARNKRSITLNLRTERGQAVAKDLAASADVIVENFRPGTMEKWGLGPEEVHARNPKTIYARVSGYGQTGRYRDRPGFASAGEAIAGLRAHQRLSRPGAPAQRHQPRRHAGRPVRLPGHPARALRARRARRAGPGRRRLDHRRLLRDARVDRRRVREDRRSCASRPGRGCRASRRPTSTSARTASGS